MIAPHVGPAGAGEGATSPGPHRIGGDPTAAAGQRRRALGYGRVSTREQAENGASLLHQRHPLPVVGYYLPSGRASTASCVDGDGWARLFARGPATSQR